MRTCLTATLAAALFIGGAGIARAADDVVEKSFFPYKNGVPAHPFVKPGTVISQANVEQAKDVLDPAMYDAIKNGWYDVHVAPTEQIDMNTAYVNATQANYKQVSLGDALGKINGFVAGRPFPQEPDINDPRAGEKLAWNYKYSVNWGDSGGLRRSYWTYRNMADGKVERVLTIHFSFLNFKHRISEPPIPDITPNPSEMYRATYLNVSYPQDVANTQLLIHRYEDDTRLDSTWLYLGFQRRVRKLSSGQVTDSFLGSDLMIEDFEGYNGRVSDMKWVFKGTRNILMPYHRHNDMKLDTEHADPDYKYISFGGKGNCFTNTAWQLRKVYEVDVIPVDSNHPISKRTMFFDAQAFYANRTISYDKAGKLWKSFTIVKSMPDHHLPVNKGKGLPIDDGFTMLDVQAGHCTTGAFRGEVEPELSPLNRFSVDALRSGN